MKDLKQHLYDLSVNWLENPIEDDLHIPSEIFKEVAIYEYLKMKNSNELILKDVTDDVAESIISETFKNYSKSISHKQRATVDRETFKKEYIHFWKTIRKKKFTGEKINILKDVISKSEFLIGNEEYGSYGWSYEQSEHFLSFCLKDFETHYWHKPKITRNLVPFYIILYALILAQNIDDDNPIKNHQRAIKHYRKNMNFDMMYALDWIVECCVELYLDNEQSYLFNSKITLSGIITFLEHFNYSKYCIKEQFYTLLKALYKETLYFENSTDLLTELRSISFIEEVHSLFQEDKYQWKLVSKWLNSSEGKQTNPGYMSSDYRMIKKYLCEYFEILDKGINISKDVFKTNSELFTYSTEKYSQNNPDILKFLNAEFSKTDSNYLFSIVLLALNAPLDNYLSYISYAEICDEIIRILPDLKKSDCYRESNGHSAGMYYLLDTVISEKVFLLQTNELSFEIINKFKYVFENPEKIFSKNFIEKHEFLSNKTFEEVLLDIYSNMIYPLK